ncbi:MAG TPA: PQQ-binding-like beta-propeller repeat protein [Bryobacteraceae bacterium]|nr:PQQ-binding-like beta-propeller repeat protein [Bryobacteraceae bacterium]
MRRRLFVAVSVASLSADWPQFRGPGRNGLSTETGLLRQWPKGGPKLLWRLPDIGDGYGSVAVAGGALYAVSNHGLDDEFVQSLSVQNGEPLWSTHLGSVGNPDQQPPYPMARSTPTLDGNYLFVLSSDGDLACLRAEAGEVVWRKNVRQEFGGTPGTWGYAESPLIDGDSLIVTPGGREATLVALHKKTGAVIWKSAVPGGDKSAYSSAITSGAAGRRQYVQFLDKGVVGVDAATGVFLWRYSQTAGGPANIASPIAKDNYVYSSNARRFNGSLVRLSASGGGISAEQVYLERDMPNTLGGQVLVGNILYGTNPQGPVAAEFATGKIHWQSTAFGPAAVLHAEGRLYFRVESGEMVLVEANPTEFRELGRFTPPDPPRRRDSRERAWTYPVVANGRLYIRDLGCLWCYDIKA